jgi:hypothetical protein
MLFAQERWIGLSVEMASMLANKKLASGANISNLHLVDLNICFFSPISSGVYVWSN